MTVVDAVTRVPAPVNEPVNDYAPGSPERAALEVRLAELWGARTDLPHWIDGQRLCRRGLPHHRVAHQGRGGRQVAPDRGEVERGDRVHEALERPVVGAVPDALAVGHRLLGEDLAAEVHVEAPEVDQLAGRVDLRLDRGLGLAQHRRRVEGLAPRPAQQLGGAQEHGRAVVVPQRTPGRRGGRGGVHRGPGVLAGGAAERSEHVGVLERGHDVRLPSAAGDALAVDPVRQVGPGPPELGEAHLERRALGAAGCVVVDGLVDGGGYSGHGVHDRHRATGRGCGIIERMPREPLTTVTHSPDGGPRGTLVLLHGLTDNGASWADAVQRWTSSGWTVVTVDARGHGHSPRWEAEDLASPPGAVMADDVQRCTASAHDAPLSVS